MSKCWGQPRKRRVSKGHGKEGRSGSLNSYRTKPLKGHQWVGQGSERMCKKCGLAPPGHGDSRMKSSVPVMYDVRKKRVDISFRAD